MNDAEQLRYLVLAAQREGARLLAEKFAKIDVTVSQAEALRVIGDNQSMSVRQLGERLICEGGNPSRLVSTLVKKGLVKTTPGERDRRELALTLTVIGAQLNDKIMQAEQVFYDEVIQRTGHAHDLRGRLLLLVSGTRSADALRLRGIIGGEEEVHEVH